MSCHRPQDEASVVHDSLVEVWRSAVCRIVIS